MEKKEKNQKLDLKIETKDLDPGALFIIKRLNNQGYEAFLVGGCIRNLLMGKEVPDWDIATSALPAEISEVFRDYKVIPIGKRFGTLTVVIKGSNYEVSTFKKSESSLDSPPNLFEDLRQRDFTINALAWGEEKGVIDYFGGLEDLQQKIIRGVEDPAERIREDPLRMLRAVRLAGELDFTLDRVTLRAIKENSALIKKVSLERIRDELIKLLMSTTPQKGFRLLQQLSLLKNVLPELVATVGFYRQGNYQEEDLFSYILDRLDHLPSDLVLRLVALLYEVERLAFTDTEAKKGGREQAQGILRRLRFKNSLIKEVNTLIQEDWQEVDFSSPQYIRRLLSRLGEENVLRIVELKKAEGKASKDAVDRRSKLSEAERIEKEVREIWQERPPLSLKDLALSGEDLAKLGYPEGKEIGEILRKLLDIVIDRPEMNKKELLIKLIKQTKGK